VLRDLGVPVIGALEAPATAEAGDMVWLDPETLLVGRGTRTNEAGIGQLASILRSAGVTVVSAPLPWGEGPDACLHLMTLMSLLDERTVLVDLEWLAVETVELLVARGFDLVEIEARERDTLACNVLALGEGQLLAFAENPVTSARLRERGFVVDEIEGSEIGVLGSGGCTCLTRPLLRQTDPTERSA
jgi:N-dimethylarginine dimethylaminohydrolase